MIKLRKEARSQSPGVKSGKKKKKNVTIDLSKFARLIKHWEHYGQTQRDIPPEIKRIVKNLTCQEHKYMYCPVCKEYEE